MNTKITLVTPSYNQASFLEETIRSVVSQRQHVHEYFLLDGGSTDGSVDIMKRYDDQIDWWVSEKDKGQSDAIHRGFQRATGDVLGWINSDDLLLPGALARIREIFDADPTVDIVAGYLVFIDAEGRIISLPRVPTGNNFLGRRGLVQVSQQSTFFRRSLYEKVGGLDLSLHCAMDFDLWSRFYADGAKWRSLPVHLAAFRKHGEAKGSGNSWWERYQAEKALVRARYPKIFGSHVRQQNMVALYRGMQLLSGRQIRSAWESAKWRGKTLVEAFGADIPAIPIS